MSNTLTTDVPLSTFNLFGTSTTSTTAYDPTRKPKLWAAPAGFDFAAHGVLDFGDFLVFPLSYKQDPTGKTPGSINNPIMVTKAEVYSLNIPPAKNPAGTSYPDPIPMPIDPSAWDAQNYFLISSALGPFAGPYVRDHRNDGAVATSFTVRDQQNIAAILAILQKG